MLFACLLFTIYSIHPPSRSDDRIHVLIYIFRGNVLVCAMQSRVQQDLLLKKRITIWWYCYLLFSSKEMILDLTKYTNWLFEKRISVPIFRINNQLLKDLGSQFRKKTLIILLDLPLFLTQIHACIIIIIADLIKFLENFWIKVSSTKTFESELS